MQPVTQEVIQHVTTRHYETLYQECENLREEVRRLKIRLEAALVEMEKARRALGSR